MQLRVERRMLPHVPWALLICSFAVALIGVWNLASASRPPHHPVWANQLVYIGLGIIAITVVSLVDYRFLYRMAIPFYVFNIVALIALRFIGHKAKGAESWIVLGPLRIQPAEFMKIGVILMLARYYHDSYRPNEPSYGLLRLWQPLLITFIPFALVLVQPDLGSAMMIGLSSATVILFGKVRKAVAVLLVTVFLLGCGLIWWDFGRDVPADQTAKTLIRHKMKPHQVKRITGWLNPESDLKGSNYHSAQSMIAVGSGELWGKGWGKGTQTGLSFLPEQHTDFIFSVWAEEHGFIACLLLLLLYGAILMTSLGVAFNARDRFGAFVAVGVASMIFWQIFENIGMVIGLLPVTGITLPLMSYGGSSLLSLMVSLGMLVNISMRRHIF